MVCNSECRLCSAKDNPTIENVSAPITAAPNSIINVNFYVNYKPCLTCSDLYYMACIYDISNPSICFVSSGWTAYPPSGYEAVSLSFPMPDRPINCAISLQSGIGIGNRCSDVVNFSVDLPPVPPGQGYTCDTISKTCFPDPQSTQSYSSCYSKCTGTPGTTGCESTEINLMGICLPKQVVLLGAILAGIYIMKS